VVHHAVGRYRANAASGTGNALLSPGTAFFYIILIAKQQKTIGGRHTITSLVISCFVKIAEFFPRFKIDPINAAASLLDIHNTVTYQSITAVWYSPPPELVALGDLVRRGTTQSIWIRRNEHDRIFCIDNLSNLPIDRCTPLYLPCLKCKADERRYIRGWKPVKVHAAADPANNELCFG